jgi:hypothetical protein
LTTYLETEYPLDASVPVVDLVQEFEDPLVALVSGDEVPNSTGDVRDQEKPLTNRSHP